MELSSQSQMFSSSKQSFAGGDDGEQTDESDSGDLSDDYEIVDDDGNKISLNKIPFTTEGLAMIKQCILTTFLEIDTQLKARDEAPVMGKRKKSKSIALNSPPSVAQILQDNLHKLIAHLTKIVLHRGGRMPAKHNDKPRRVKQKTVG